jgi:hypothetical protein
MAFHYYPLRILRVELLGMAGSFSGNPTYATRPVAILDLGWLKLKAGTEYQRSIGQHPGSPFQTTQKGVGGAVQFVFLPHLEFGLNAAQGTIWSIKGDGKFDPKGSLTRTSFGGFANISNGSRKHPLLFGLGTIFTRNVDQNDAFSNGVVDNYWQLQSFIAIQYVAFQQLYIKLVGGYAKGHWITADDDPPIVYDDEMYSVRLRFSFYFYLLLLVRGREGQRSHSWSWQADRHASRLKDMHVTDVVQLLPRPGPHCGEGGGRRMDRQNVVNAPSCLIEKAGSEPRPCLGSSEPWRERPRSRGHVLEATSENPDHVR